MNGQEILEVRRNAWFKFGKIQVDAHQVRELCDMSLDCLELKGGIQPMRFNHVLLGFIIGFAFATLLGISMGSVHADSVNPWVDSPSRHQHLPNPSVYGTEPNQIYQTPLESFPGSKHPCP